MLGAIPQLSGDLWLAAPIYRNYLKYGKKLYMQRRKGFTAESGSGSAAPWENFQMSEPGQGSQFTH